MQSYLCNAKYWLLKSFTPKKKEYISFHYTLCFFFIKFSDLNVQWYIPFYSLYFILTGLHVNFANTSFGLARRFQSLNTMLRNSYLPGTSIMIFYSIYLKYI